MSDERRSGTRHRAWTAMRLHREESGSWVVMGRNLSRSGVLLATGARLAVGELVALSFRPTPSSDTARTVKGTVVRVEHDVEDKGGAWPHRAAVSFHDEDPEAEDLVLRDSGTWSAAYLTEIEEEDNKEEAEAEAQAADD